MANSLLITVLGVVLVATACSGLKFSYDYLERPERYLSTADDMYSIKILKRLKLEDGASYEQVIEGLRELRKWPKRRGDEMYIDVWLGLAQADGDCHKNLPELFLNLFENLKETTILKHNQLLLDTLTHYGATKFESCAAKALEAIERAKSEEKVVEAERFFKRVLDLDENASERDFYRKLKALNVIDADWNVGFLLAEAHSYDKKDHRNRNFVIDKYHFLFVNSCFSFEDHMSQSLDIINLVNDMKPDANYFKGNNRLKRLNELRRICMDFRRYQPKFYANLSKKVSLKNRVLVPLRNKLGI